MQKALEDAGITPGKLHKGLDATKRRQAWTEGQQVIAVSDAGDQHQLKAMGAKWPTLNELRHGNDKAPTALKFGA
jgi:hypothetical protein